MSKWFTNFMALTLVVGLALTTVSFTGCTPAKDKPADEAADDTDDGEDGDEQDVDAAPAVEPGDEPADEPGDEPGDEPMDEPGDEPVDEPADEPGDEPGDEPLDVPVIEPPVDVPVVEPPVDEPPADEPADDTAVEQTEPLKKAELLVELPWKYNTPDGMCLLPSGDIILAVPNVNSFLAQEDKSKQDPAPVLLKVTKDGEVSEWYKPPVHPKTGLAFPFGICIDPEGKNFYMTDLQWFANMEDPGNNSRVLRIPLDENYNPAGDPVVVIEGMVVANAVVVRDGKLYVSDTSMVPGTDPVITGVFAMDLKEEGLVLTKPIEKDPHMLASIESKNTKVGFGADGLTFDSKGNLYIANFADGLLHKVEFNEDGTVKSNTVFAKDKKMRCCDGIFYDKKTDKIYVADSLANAVQIVDPKDGSVVTLAQDENNDGSNGRLDQPCEVLVRDGVVVVSNMDFPIPTGVNTTFDAPYTLSIIKLDDAE